MNNKQLSVAAKKIIFKYKKHNKNVHPNAFYTEQETEKLIKYYRLQQLVRVKILKTKYHLIEDVNQLKKLLDPLVNTVEKIGIDTEPLV